MSRLFLPLIFGACALFIQAPVSAQDPLPVLDMHLHAVAADAQEPPPVGICTPVGQFPAWDPAKPYGATFMGLLKQPPCDAEDKAQSE